MQKKIFVLTFLVFLVSAQTKIFCDIVHNVNEVSIENGLTVFTLEDYSTPLIRIELCVRAGTSSQSAKSAGFFELLIQLIQKTSSVNFSEVLCASDSVRFIVNVSPENFSDVMQKISDDIFNPIFSDAILKQELTKAKRKNLQNVSDPAYLINSCIDSRIFSDAPWQHESGIHAELFSKITEKNARTILNEIIETFFTPQNSAVFISGNIKSGNAINLCDETFGKFYSNKKINFKPISIPVSTSKKFIIHDKDFSDELTQIVTEYTTLSLDECSLASTIYNNENSDIKNLLSENSLLGIAGNEYINIANAYKTGCSRLIFQSLLQNTKNISSFEQVSVFLETLKNNFSGIEYEKYKNAITEINRSFSSSISSSNEFMDLLSQFWAIKPFYSENKFNYNSANNFKSQTAFLMASRNENITDISVENFSEQLAREEPFVFVIMNTKNYNAEKNKFIQNGFEEVTTQNSFWYLQSAYKNVKTLNDLQNLSNSNETARKNINLYSDNFYNENISTFFSEKLSNNIPVIFKENKNTTGITILISISGGNLRSAENHGFEEVMINILTMNILRQIKNRQKSFLISNNYEIYSETKLDSSRIIIECDKEDFLPVLKSISDALIFGEIIPSDADRIVQGRRTRKRLYNGSVANQLYSNAINEIFPKSDFQKIFEAKNEILVDTTYEKILENYPTLLDAARFSIIISGNINLDDQKNQVEEIFSILKEHSARDENKKNKFMSEINFPKGKQKRVKLVHTFLTDISAKDAGPRPQVLIPTNTFADPVLFCINLSEIEGTDFFICNALLPYIQERFEKAAAEKNNLFNCKFYFERATEIIPFATFSFSSVERTSAADSLYKTTIKNIIDDLSNTKTSAKTTQDIKDAFIFYEYENAQTNSASAILIDESLKQDSEKLYLENYLLMKNLTAEKFISILENYFPFENLFRLYSADSKR